MAVTVVEVSQSAAAEVVDADVAAVSDQLRTCHRNRQLEQHHGLIKTITSGSVLL
jgi:hypothetical protein